MKPEDFVSKQLIEEQIALLKTAAEQVHALFCIANHADADDCQWYEQSWEGTSREYWMDAAVHLMRSLGLSDCMSLLTFIAKAREIIASNGEVMIDFLYLIAHPELLEESFANEDMLEHTVDEQSALPAVGQAQWRAADRILSSHLTSHGIQASPSPSSELPSCTSHTEESTLDESRQANQSPDHE